MGLILVFVRLRRLGDWSFRVGVVDWVREIWRVLGRDLDDVLTQMWKVYSQVGMKMDLLLPHHSPPPYLHPPPPRPLPPIHYQDLNSAGPSPSRLTSSPSPSPSRLFFSVFLHWYSLFESLCRVWILPWVWVSM